MSAERVVVAGLVLAAGESRRMGRLKPLLPAGEEPFVLRVRRALRDAGLSPVYVVVGHRADEIIAATGLGPADVVHNPNYAQGMLSSIIAGVRALESSDARALVLALVDGPDISAAVVRALVAAFAERPEAPIVEPVSGDRHGHPVLLNRAIWPDLLAADLAEGAKAVVRQYRPLGVQVPVDDPAIFLDLDTPEQYVAWAARGATP